MKSGHMTALGAVGAMLTFINAGLPAETPVWLSLGLGGILAGVMFYLGTTNQGTKKSP